MRKADIVALIAAAMIGLTFAFIAVKLGLGGF